MKKILFYALAIMAAMTFGVSANAKAPKANKPKAQHVVLLGLDGWGAYSVPKATDIPNIKYFMDNGCYTLTDRSVLPSSSAINWASMFMGVPTEVHGYTTWGSQAPEVEPLVKNSHNISPTIFSIIREQMPKAETGCLYEWDGIRFLVDTLAINHVAEAKNWDKDNFQLCRMSAEYIKAKKPTFVAVCFNQVDAVGHRAGHDTPEYYASLQSLDKQIGIIIDAIKEAGMWDDTIIILTADHGGIDHGHGEATLPEMEVPFIIWGKGIKQGGKITEIMMQYDCAATVAECLGLKRPSFWRGVPTWSAFK